MAGLVKKKVFAHDATDDGIRELLGVKSQAADANQLLIGIMERWGGVRAFAEALHTEFCHARPGSLIRQNILEMIQKLVVNNTNHGVTKVDKPSDLEDEDIEFTLIEMTSRAVRVKSNGADRGGKEGEESGLHEGVFQEEGSGRESEGS